MPLLNAFVDSIVCVGFNSERGLILDPQSDKNSSPLLSLLEPYVLAILTADQAIYPQSKENYIIDESYSSMGHSSKFANVLDSGTKSQKKNTIANAFNHLPLFCSPDGVKVSHQQEAGRIHHIVFTQEEGKRSYAVVLTFQQKFILKTDKPGADGAYQIESLVKTTTTSKIPIDLPTNLTRKPSKKMPSSYRHGVTNPPNSIQSNNSTDTIKKDETSNLNIPVKNVRSSDLSSSTPNFIANNPNSYTYMNNMSNGISRMRHRSTSNSSLSSNTLNRTSSTIIFNTSEPFYLPNNLVLISSHPYWIAMHEMISTIYDEILQKEIEPNSNDYKYLIQKYAFFACNTPIPPIAWERFSLSFNLKNNQSVLTFDPPIHTNHTVLDLDLSTLLLTLNIGKLLDVLAAIFTQQSIIFFSTDYSKLVTTLECLLYLIYPLKWVHVYIPILPDKLRDYYLEGPPGSYIIGVHSRYQTIVEDLNISVTCNLDNDKNIHIPSDIIFHRIPSTKLRRFIGPITDFIEQMKIARSLQHVHSPIRLRIDEKREYERQHRVKANNKIIEIFLDLMVDLFDDTLKPIYWKMDNQQKKLSNSLTQLTNLEKRNFISNKKIFSKEKYLLSKTEGVEREFYKIFIQTTAFQLFIEEEMTSTNLTEFRKICQLRSQSNQDQTFQFNNSLKDKQIKSTTSLFDTTYTSMLFPLPDLLSLPDWPLDTSTHYLDSCIEIFTDELEDAQEKGSPPIISIYAYLRGCALLARGQILDGLRDLYLIENPNLFPKTYIETTIVPLLSNTFLLDLFLHESFYIKSAEWKKINTHSIYNDMSPISLDQPIEVKPSIDNEPIENDLTLEQFHEHLYRLSIINDKETTEILFKALLRWMNTTNKSNPTKIRRRWSIASGISKEILDMSESQTLNLSSNSLLPAKLYEFFLEIWQQTNAEKARMNYYLPKDRQKQESILMISSSDITSKKDGCGKLILTQKGIYFLPETRSSAFLLSELLKIVYIENYQHKTRFASSKPAIKIFAFHSSSSSSSSTNLLTLKQQDAEPTVILFFKDNHEQNFWYKIIFELWSGVSIAHEECDTTIFHKISTNMALIDTIVNIDYNEQILSTNSTGKSKQVYNQVSIDMALNDLTIFTRMQKNGTFKKLTNETRNALHHRLSPLINETERYAVRCLIFTENPDNEYSLLWCAYGKKLKIFNTTTWICDPNDLSFPSLITCMCLDGSYKIWIGCIDGQIFIVDTIQRICGTQLALIEGNGGCQTITYDVIRNQILIANRFGLVIIWDANNKQRLININLEEIYKKTYNIKQRKYKSEMILNLSRTIEQSPIVVSSTTNINEIFLTSLNELKSIQIYENLLFACYRDNYILIFRITNSNIYTYEHIFSVKYNNDYSMPINSFLVYKQQLWISTSYIIYVFNINNKNKENSYDLIMKKNFEDDHLLTMLGFSDYIWAGSSRGNVYIIRMDNYETLKTFDGHKAEVCCLCPMLDMYIISGSGQYDTSIVIWENIQTNDNVITSRF